MIDYLRCRIPCALPYPIQDGETVVFDREQNVRVVTPHRLGLPGSFEAKLHVRSRALSWLEIEGNPAKWLQGHNLFGPDDLPALLWQTVVRVLDSLPDGPLTPEQCGITPASLAGTLITRVDCTYMLHLNSRADVLAWIRSAELNGRAGRRGRGVFHVDTLVFGDATNKNFARWQIAIYAKGPEIEKNRLPEPLMQEQSVREWADKSLRVEVRLGRLELEKQGLRLLSGWHVDKLPNCKRPNVVAEMWRSKVATLDFNTSAEAHFDLETLPRHLRSTYVAWKAGADVRMMVSKATFYRYRSQLQELTGIDITIPPPLVPSADIVPLRRVLEARPVGRPPWADRMEAILAEHGCIALAGAA